MCDEYFMGEALREAEAALLAGDLPIGAVVVVGGAVRARARWAWEPDHDLLAHPEIVAVRSAGARGGTLFTTLEPCVMCIGAAMSGFLDRVVYALDSPTDGGGRLPALYRSRLPASGRSWSIPDVVAGVRHAESRALIERFLREGRPGPMREWARSLVDPHAAEPA